MKGRSGLLVVSLALLASAGCSSAVRSRAVTLADGGSEDFTYRQMVKQHNFLESLGLRVINEYV